MNYNDYGLFGQDAISIVELCVEYNTHANSIELIKKYVCTACNYAVKILHMIWDY